MSSAATICVACGTAFDGDDGDGNAPTPAGKRHYDHGPKLVPMGVGRGVWACRETRVVVRTPVTRGQPARGPQDSDKPHHNNRERVLRRERSGGNPDEKSPSGNMSNLQVWTRWSRASRPPRQSVPSRCMITVSESPYRATSMTSDGLRLRARIALPRHRRHRPAELAGDGGQRLLLGQTAGDWSRIGVLVTA